MPLKPQVSAQLMTSMGMGRIGGAASRGSTPSVKNKGGNFASLENALLKKGVKNPAQAKKVASGGPGRQFQTSASGGDTKLSTPSSDTPVKTQPGVSLKAAWGRTYKGSAF